MTTEYLEDDQLQRYFDGELTDGEAETIRAVVTESELEEARLKQLEKLHGFVDMALDDYSAELAPGDADTLFARIEQGVEASASEPRDDGGFRVILGGGQSEAPSARKTWAPAAVAVAIAAAVGLAFLLRPPADPIAEDATQAPIEEVATVVHVEPPAGSQVLEVDFGANTGTVFEVEGAAGQPLAVVWIQEEELP